MRIDPEKLFGTNAPLSTDVRIRYSYDQEEGTPRLKNTLLSFAYSGCIYFGIARCNLDSGDRFSRKIGRSIALRRALSAWDDYSLPDDLVISSNLLRGTCPLEKAKKMVEHFKCIDDTIEDCRQKVFAEFERLRAERKAKAKETAA